MIEVEQKIKIKDSDIKNSFQVIILNLKPTTNSFNGKILGRPLKDWVAFACSGYKTSVYDFDMKQNIIDFAKDKIDKNYTYTLVLLSSTPLLEQTTIHHIIEYCEIKQVNVCKLPIGYVLKNNYFESGVTPQVDSLYSQNIDNFYVVETKKQYSFALTVLQDRINNFHLDNGVEITNIKSVYIEPDVDIESGVIIHSNNVIKGNSLVGRDVILNENNVIENSKIGQGSCIGGSVIKASVISNNVYIASFCDINNSLIGNDTIIERGAIISGYKVDSNQRLKPNTILGESDDSDNRTGKSGQ